jgi:hypothetical protein
MKEKLFRAFGTTALALAMLSNAGGQTGLSADVINYFKQVDKLLEYARVDFTPGPVPPLPSNTTARDIIQSSANFYAGKIQEAQGIVPPYEVRMMRS